uniref:Fe-S cluster assembly ATPase SufC n=1 Tax=Rhizochromulina marina TaxID=1034831 RepID=A0A514CPW8_9STRA|nr:Fe-S cluster assembly ATPase SufC [Rhizochromulina marina]QDH81846.1 Fe-S cluster assembly ATPase SufC [Rhizochromulina marina]
MLLKIENLHAGIDNREILKGVNLTIQAGEVHAIMGINGSGKSTLSKVLTGHPGYQIKSGNIFFNGEDITFVEPEERALRGIFLAFQYPLEVPGVSNEEFLRTAFNIQQQKKGLKELDPIEFFQVLTEKLNRVGLKPDFLTRNVNEGFSGGEKKRNEIFQLITLDSKFCILDEIDSGLDIDALRSISSTINQFLQAGKSILIITHYKRLLDYIRPDFVHVMRDGQIVKTGDITLADALEEKGYDWIVS